MPDWMKKAAAWFAAHNIVTHAFGFGMLIIAVVYIWVTTPHDAVGFGAIAGTGITLIGMGHLADKSP